MERITPAELRVIELIVQGKTNRAISEETGKSQNTVKNQIHSILSKLGIPNRKELIYQILSKKIEI